MPGLQPFYPERISYPNINSNWKTPYKIMDIYKRCSHGCLKILEISCSNLNKIIYIHEEHEGVKSNVLRTQQIMDFLESFLQFLHHFLFSLSHKLQHIPWGKLKVQNLTCLTFFKMEKNNNKETLAPCDNLVHISARNDFVLHRYTSKLLPS